MTYLTEIHKITIRQIIGDRNNTRTQMKDFRLFHKKFSKLQPLSQGTISKIKKQFCKLGQVRQKNSYHCSK